MSDYKRSTGTNAKRLRGSLDASDHRPRQRSRPDHDQTARHDRGRLWGNVAGRWHHWVGGRWSLVWGKVITPWMPSEDHDHDHDDEFTNTAETTNKKTTTTDESHAKTTTRQERAELGAMAPCEACGAEVFADYRHFCLRCGLRLPLTPSSPSPKPAAEMVINKKPASKVIKKPKTKTAKKRAR